MIAFNVFKNQLVSHAMAFNVKKYGHMEKSCLGNELNIYLCLFGYCHNIIGESKTKCN